jgi:hypothetical protein
VKRGDVILNWAMVPASAVLLALLGLSLLRLGPAGEGNERLFRTAPLPPPHPAADQTRRYFDWPLAREWVPLTNHRNPFFTLAIQPPPPPRAAAPPPATRKVDVTYKGYFETSAGTRRALVQVAETQVLGGYSDPIVADFAAHEIELRHLTLTNAGGQTVRLEFAKPQSLEIPAK